MKRRIFSFFIFLVFHFAAFSQPDVSTGGVRFALPDKGYTSVSVVGDFNGWSREENKMSKSSSDTWSTTLALQTGIYQYLFVVNGETYLNDPNNPVVVANYNQSGQNSVFVLHEDGTIELTATPPVPKANPTDDYPQMPSRKPVYLNIIWHQHQPLYLNPATDQLEGPWVRTHATKDYYDMAAMLQQYPNVHCNINLTSSLLYQLQEYYVKRLKPFVDVQNNSLDAAGFLRKWKGKTDPWIDLMLKPTTTFDDSDKNFLLTNTWNAFGISEVQIARFPEYEALKKRFEENKESTVFTERELRQIKFFFYLAHFDPDFLRGAVALPIGSVCDLSNFVEYRPSTKTFHLKGIVTEADCERLLVETYKVMASVVPIHTALRYDAKRKRGQLDVITTPFYHPILPLIYDSDLAKTCQPNDQLPARFSYPRDAEAHVVKSVKFYKEIFGVAPTGMWPGEGSVAQPVLRILRDNGILWTASDVKVLKRSEPNDMSNTAPYRFDAGKDAQGRHQGIALVFRDTELSDRIGFKYQTYTGEAAAEDFVRSILSYAPKKNDRDVMVTVILDGENAWEWYRKDIDGKEFLNALYRKLSKLYATKQVITTTMSEYILGNLQRGIAEHPIETMPRMKSLWPGSWINANYDTWIGEPEENRAWEYLRQARQDLMNSGLTQPDPMRSPPPKDSQPYYAYMAYEAMYAAEGSDWFWWYGADQSAPAGDKPFDEAFRIHLKNVYAFAAKAGARITAPSFDPIIHTETTGGQGVMARSVETQRVLFVVDAKRENVSDAIYIVGNLKALGEWTPNSVRMYDDGTHGDALAHDSLWSLELDVPIGANVQYKFTNSGKKGEWIPGEEFPSEHRSALIRTRSEQTIIIIITFGKK
jgi:alpha-amylase/alpha-mannosidase (GH57 family)